MCPRVSVVVRGLDVLTNQAKPRGRALSVLQLLGILTQPHLGHGGQKTSS